jgi:hypothetical protein
MLGAAEQESGPQQEGGLMLQPEPEAEPLAVVAAGEEKPLDRERRRQAATVCLQRAHRRAARLRPSNSTDPFTLEELCPANCQADQPLFRYVDASGVLTAIQARALADYGIAAGELVHPLSRARLNSCEILRLEHTLVGAGFANYAGLAAQLSESVTQPTIVPAVVATQLSMRHVDSNARHLRRM